MESVLQHMNKLTKFKLNILPKIVLAALIGLGILSLSVAFRPEQFQTKSFKVTSSTLAPSPNNKEVFEKPTPKPISKVVIFAPKPTPKAEPTPLPTASPNNFLQASEKAVSDYKINVSIAGTSGFELSITEGANHCDVLSKALSQGKISSLSMKFDDNLKTYAIYQINGIGKENSVWWVYEVNGQSPSQGCSYIKVNNGDKVEWKYLGNI